MAVKETLPAKPESRKGSTRFERGLALAGEHFEEIVRVAPWTWSVPRCSGEGVCMVNLKTGLGSCPDRVPEGEECKHVTAARVVKARTATCSGCRARFRHKALVDAPEGNGTFHEGELLCRPCGRSHGVL